MDPESITGTVEAGIHRGWDAILHREPYTHTRTHISVWSQLDNTLGDAFNATAAPLALLDFRL